MREGAKARVSWWRRGACWKSRESSSIRLRIGRTEITRSTRWGELFLRALCVNSAVQADRLVGPPDPLRRGPVRAGAPFRLPQWTRTDALPPQADTRRSAMEWRPAPPSAPWRRGVDRAWGTRLPSRSSTTAKPWRKHPREHPPGSPHLRVLLRGGLSSPRGGRGGEPVRWSSRREAVASKSQEATPTPACPAQTGVFAFSRQPAVHGSRRRPGHERRPRPMTFALQTRCCCCTRTTRSMRALVGVEARPEGP